MKENEKLHALNNLYHKPNARVAVGDEEGQRIMESLAQTMQTETSSDEEEKLPPRRKLKPRRLVKPLAALPKYSNAPKGTSINPSKDPYPNLEYSLCEH